MWRNETKCKYMFMYLLRNLARKGLTPLPVNQNNDDMANTNSWTVFLHGIAWIMAALVLNVVLYDTRDDVRSLVETLFSLFWYSYNVSWLSTRDCDSNITVGVLSFFLNIYFMDTQMHTCFICSVSQPIPWSRLKLPRELLMLTPT